VSEWAPYLSEMASFYLGEENREKDEDEL